MPVVSTGKTNYSSKIQVIYMQNQCHKKPKLKHYIKEVPVKTDGNPVFFSTLVFYGTDFAYK